MYLMRATIWMIGGFMTARQIMVRALAEVSGRPESVFLTALSRLPVQPPGLEKEYTPRETEEMLAAFRREAPGILRWLVQGALEGDAWRQQTT
jgi:hypothetical protein